MQYKLIAWSKKYSVGIKRFDDDHKEFIKILNKLHNEIMLDTEICPVSIRELERFAKRHFTEEEELMRKYRFKNFARHKKQHDMFRRKIEDIKKDDSPMICLELMSFLTAWLNRHIIDMDTKYSELLRKNKIH